MHDVSDKGVLERVYQEFIDTDIELKEITVLDEPFYYIDREDKYMFMGIHTPILNKVKEVLMADHNKAHELSKLLQSNMDFYLKEKNEPVTIEGLGEYFVSCAVTGIILLRQ